MGQIWVRSIFEKTAAGRTTVDLTVLGKVNSERKTEGRTTVSGTVLVKVKVKYGKDNCV